MIRVPVRFYVSVALAVLAGLWPAGAAHADPGIIRVRPEGTAGWPCGDSWETACELQTALANAAAGDELWVASGTYRPTAGTDRTISFQLRPSVAVYGGFRGDEEEQERRDWVANPTILSGDIGIQGDAADNSYHVVSSTAAGDLTVLDGVTVRDGHAGGPTPLDRGGGMYNDGSSPTVANVRFEENAAVLGGGMYNNAAERPALSNVTFARNTATEAGGGVYNYSSKPVIIGAAFVDNSAPDGAGMYNTFSRALVTNAIFEGNVAGHWGGGVYNAKCRPVLINASFSDNSAEFGGAMANHWASPSLFNVTIAGNRAGSAGAIGNVFYSVPVIRNSILWDNAPDGIASDPNSQADVAYSDVQGGYSGPGNIDADPRFVAGTLRLGTRSPAVDAGDNSAGLVDGEDLDGDGDLAEPLPFDLAGRSRFADVLCRPDSGFGSGPIIDMGAYETNPLIVALPLISR